MGYFAYNRKAMERMTYLWRMASIRLEKFSALIRKELSIIFQKNGREWFAGSLITVTLVRISPDLGYAKVYVSIFPTESKESILKWLKENHFAVRRELGLSVGKQMRKIPELQFFFDDSMEYSAEIERLLKK
jgi:ribosome-binding factor A